MKRFSHYVIPVVVCLLVVIIGIMAQLPGIGHAQSSTIKVQYTAGNTSTTINKIQPNFQIVNSGSSAISLSQFTIRYWFTRDTAKAVSVTCDYASIGCSDVTETATAFSPATTSADYYLQVGFTSGSVAANSNSGTIKIRAWKSDFSNFTQSNDYSFNAADTSFTDWQNVALYQNGTLIWGTQPGGAATPTATSTSTLPASTPTPIPTITPTSTPPATSFSQAQIDAAVAAPLLSFPAPTTSNPRPGDGPVQVYNSKAFYFLALVSWYNPNATASNGTSVANRLVASIGSVITGGNEPDANGGLEGWGHNDVAQGLVLARHESSVWSQLTSAQQAKVDLLMEALAVAGNYDFNDANNFSADLDGLCKFNKSYNPNYREGYLNVVLAASVYFGPTALNNFFTSFNYSSFTSQLQSAGFTNILTIWANDQTLLTSGGSDGCGGSGSGVREAFTYNNIALSNPVGIFAQLATFTYQDTVTSTGAGGKAYIVDNTTSPYQGQQGMEHEFNTSDSDGARSDALYAYEGWMNSISSRTTFTVLGDWGCGTTQQQVEALENVGSGDLLYKLQHGYEGYYLGANRLVNETTPASDGPSSKGFYFDQQLWNNVLSPVKAC